MGSDPNTPDWVQHIAFELEDMDALLAAKQAVEAEGLEVIGPTNHGIFHSIYFRDPNGYVVELAARMPDHDAATDPSRNGARAILDRWQAAKEAD